jgi:hypothetical protein
MIILRISIIELYMITNNIKPFPSLPSKPKSIKTQKIRWLILFIACKFHKYIKGIVLMGDAFSFDNP